MTEQDKEEIKKIKYVENVETKIIMAGERRIILNEIIVDDWKHCQYVQKYFDEKGIQVTPREVADIIEDYSSAKNFSNVIKYIFIIMSVLILIVCYKNILKNEEENTKLLRIIGYRKSKTKAIIFTYLIILTMLGLVLGVILFELSIMIISEILKRQLTQNLINNIITNVVIILLAIFIAIEAKWKKL